MIALTKLLSCAGVAGAMTASVTAGPVAVFVETKDPAEFDCNGLLNLTVCNVYVEFNNPADRLVSIVDANITTNDPVGFFQTLPGVGEDTAPLAALVAIFPELVCDSFVTINRKLDNNDDGTVLDPDFDSFAFNNSGPLSGGWFLPCLDPQGDVDQNNRVLIAQLAFQRGFTASGSFHVYSTDGDASFSFICPGCNNDEECDDGLECTDDFCEGGVCVNIPTPAGTACGDPTQTPCDNPDTCNGLGDCEPNFEPPGTICEADGDLCTIDECDGGGGCSTVDQVECPPGWVCEPASGECVPDVAGGCCQCFGSVQFCSIESPSDCLALGGVYLGDGTACDNPGTVVAVANPNLPIPDNNVVGVSDTITITDSFAVADLDVDLSIDHTWVGDLCVVLKKDGTTVEILRRPGLAADTCGPGTCCGCQEDNYVGIILDDEGVGPIENLCTVGGNMTSPPSYTPNNPLSAFDGLDSAGDWTITVSDGAAQDTGTLVEWSLHISPSTGLTPCEQEQFNQCGGACPWDCAGDDNVVDTVDFLALLAGWGMAGGPCDFGQGNVGIDTPDFLQLLANWGPCDSPGAGDCCEANGTPGCDHLPCEREVCSVDPFCCDVAWDAKCSFFATTLDVCGCLDPVAHPTSKPPVPHAIE